MFRRKQPQGPERCPYHIVTVQPGDIVIINSAKRLDKAAYERIRSQIHAALPDNAVLVLDDGLSASVQRTAGPREGLEVAPSTTGVTNDSSISPGLDPGDPRGTRAEGTDA